MSRLVSDSLNAKKKCKHADEKVLFIIKYVSDLFMTQQMCDQVILENGGMLVLAHLYLTLFLFDI